MRIDVLTVFPEMVDSWLHQSLVGRARKEALVDVRVHDLRSAASEPRRSVDDSPFGGGPGMVLAPGPIFDAVETLRPPRPLIYLGPAGRRLDQAEVRRLAGLSGFSLLCGRYEGVDQRVIDYLVDDELSIGDYVIPGGESASLVVIEAVTRLLPGVMGNVDSAGEESFSEGLLEYPHYTRPATFRGWAVPEVLVSGHHRRVARWRQARALALTLARRPDLIAGRGGLSGDEMRLLSEDGYPGLPPGADGAGAADPPEEPSGR